MKTLIINSELQLKEIEFTNSNEVYKFCGYKIDKNYVCLHKLNRCEYIIEIWGKHAKKTYNFNNFELSGKCAFLVKKQGFTEYIDIDIELFNKIITMKDLIFDKKEYNNDKAENIIKKTDIDKDNNIDENNDREHDNDENDENDENDDVNNENYNNNEDDNNEDHDNNEDDNNEDDDNRDIEDMEDNDDNECNEDNVIVSESPQFSFYSKKDKFKDKSNDNTFDKLLIDKNKININEIISNQLEKESYIYSSDEDDV